MENISVVVQGGIFPNLTSYCLASIRHLLPNAEIILSTWINEDITDLQYDILIKSEKPKSFFVQKEDNVNLQIHSTVQGIKAATGEYILKIRSDIFLKDIKWLEYFKNFDNYNNDYKIFKKRLLICSFYSRSSMNSNYLYHPSDWIAFGLKEDVLKYYNAPLQTKEEENAKYFLSHVPVNFSYLRNKLRRFVPEQYLFVSCLNKNNFNVNFIDHTDINYIHRVESEKYIINNFIILDYGKSWGGGGV